MFKSQYMSTKVIRYSYDIVCLYASIRQIFSVYSDQSQQNKFVYRRY